MASHPGCTYSLLGSDEIQHVPDPENERSSAIGKTDNHRMGQQQWNKFALLMWKNWVLQYRKPIQTVVEIIAPVLFSILLVIIRSLVDPEQHPPRIFNPFCPIAVPYLCENPSNDNGTNSWSNMSFFQNVSLAYSPVSNTKLNASMSIFSFIFGENATISIKGYENARELEAHFLTPEGNLTLAGLQFPDSLAGRDDLPDDVEVSLRFPGELRLGVDIFGQNNWRTNLLYPVYQTPGPRSENRSRGAAPGYYAEGFLTLQAAITYILILGQNNATSMADVIRIFYEKLPPVIKMQRFPYASWIEDPLLQALESFVSMIILLSFVYPCINTVKMITAEKEKQLKEAMKIMGLPNWLHWTAWFVKTMSFLLISIVLITILLKVSWYPDTTYSVFTHANPLVMLLFLFIYVCATITFCFAISVFFSKANTAATVAGLLWFLSYAPYLFLQQQYDTLSLTTKLVASLGSNTAMAYGFQLMLMFEGTSEGVQWDNIWRPNTPDDNLTLGLIMVMLVIDAVIYLIVAIYIEAVFPGDYGVPLPWYFPFTASYWCGNVTSVGVEDVGSTTSFEGEFFEKEPTDLPAGIQIRNLRKVFGGNKAAVRNLSLNMYENHITVLLGHNGAGKTTTMSMLTGMFPPTSGTAIVNGHDIRTNMKAVRASLGLCPQHNILFDELTVKEHLYFFSKLKGLDKAQIAEEINTYVNLLELQSKIDAKSSTLSGGMKRKLCVGMALCGNSKIVMLDEPTAGMDPSARRALWDLLQKQKQGRTMLLTTHFMDEADLLGDRIAIMAGGELQCCGSSFFLKKKYGAGYHLIMEKSQTCNPNDVTRLLQKHIPNLEIEGNVGSELTYILSENQVSVFEEMLRDLEQNSRSIGVRSYGISLTTLEEVFMKVGADHGQEETYNNEILQQNSIDDMNDKSWRKQIQLKQLLAWLKRRFKENAKHNDVQSQETKLTIENTVLLEGFQLVQNQFLAMLMKKMLSTFRTWILLFVQILMPVAFLIIAIVVIRNANRSGDMPRLPITLDSYDDPVTIVHNDDTQSGTLELNEIYTGILRDSGHQIKVVENVTETMIQLTDTIPSTVRLRYLVGATFGTPEPVNILLPSPSVILAWFNNDPYHTPPLALGLALNTVYKKVMGSSDYNIRFVNHPLPFTADTKVQQLLQGNSMGFQLAFNLGFSMAFVSSFYVLFYVRERVCKSKHLQFVSGVKVFIFWIVALICDLFTFVITSIAILITLVCFQEEGFRSPEEIGRIFLILLYFGFAMLPMMYFAAYLFDVPSTGYTRMTLFSIFTGVAAFLVVQVLGTDGLDLEYVANTLHWIFLIIPHYSLATGIRDTYMTFATNKMCKFVVETCMETMPGMTEDRCWYMACHNNTQALLSDYCCDRTQNFFKWESPGIGRNLLYSFTIGGILFALLLINEYKLFSTINEKLRHKYVPKKPQDVPNEDSDVLEEKLRIRNTSLAVLQKENILVLKNLTKYYKKFLAVNGLCLGVKRFECFGLLGINGAGKTTTFKMMTGDVRITYGDAWVDKHNIKTELKEVQKRIGYCPQFDALLDDLTARESLIMFALLRGIPTGECNGLAEKLAKDFDFSRHLDKQVKELSGGNKRKLSTAISLIGDPPVMYLDEPTTGMDPATKRFLWNTLCQVRDNGKCVVLTSHSMEECEALCTRLAIMVNGNFKCLGSTQHLKSKFSEGYTLTIKIRKHQQQESGAGIEKIERFIRQHFPKAVQREKHQELLTYYIVDKSLSWSAMFGILERGKKELDIEDYSLGQSSLEQVFLTFTKSQIST